jgi:phosphatidylglycerophosphatase A
VSWADQKLEGGFGVMADDMLAGLMAGLVVLLVRIGVPL